MTQLRLYALERTGPLFNVRFAFQDEPHRTVCSIYHSSLDAVFQDVTTKEALYEEYFSGWIATVRKDISKILADLPTLKAEFDPTADVVFRIVSDYGTGGDVVCTITGGDVLWHFDPTGRTDGPEL